MKRSMQEVVELVVFALIALLIGTGLVWLAGWILGLVGTVLTWLAGLVWSLLRFLVPVAVVAGLVYLLVQFLTRSGERVARGPQEQPPTPPSPWTMSKEPPAPAAGPTEASAASATTEADPPAESAPDASGDEGEGTAGVVSDAPQETPDAPADEDDDRPKT
jgi:predicted lipid-binding transport protein (Tim44 family)